MNEEAISKPDVAVCDFLAASLNFPTPLPVPTLLFQHNVEAALWNRQQLHEKNPLKKLIFRIEYTAMANITATKAVFSNSANSFAPCP